MEKKNVILLTVVAVATLLVTVVGATFAYFTATINNQDNEDISITSASGLAITYNNGTTIEGSNILPGWGIDYDKDKSYEMTITNETDFDVTYTLKWNAVTNGFDTGDQKNLTYSLTPTVTWIQSDQHQEEGNTAAVGEVTSAQFPATSSEDTIATQTLKSGEQAKYVVKVAYKYDEENEQESKGANFTAKIQIDNDTIQVKKPAA